MTRTSPAEVRGLFRRVVVAAEAAGVDVSGWECWDEGYGQGWQFGAPAAASPQLLGKTAREAALTLSGMARALELVPAREVAR